MGMTWHRQVVKTKKSRYFAFNWQNYFNE